MTPRAHPTNLIEFTADFLSSPDFNAAGARIEITNVRSFNRDLFAMLDDSPTLADAERAFMLYMNALFAIDVEQAPTSARTPFRSCFLKLLQGWGFDSNGPEGAVMKGWVESRFGLRPSYHKHPLDRDDPQAWVPYLKEKMDSRFHSNSIYSQLDLLYEFIQYILRRFIYQDRTHITVYRGLNLCEATHLNRKACCLMWLNNCVSTSTDPDVAGCFGDIIVKIRAPVSKILFVNNLLSIRPLRGEGEVLLIGGDFWVTPQS
ncbi:NAD+--dinitrogen-reductase ADP-D-ribosyltransferase [Rhodoblastus acidophilus]|uniref:NAD(+)--dinitrogen-reductase ADP-D-ribosyltransferase n=1 Tax=Rhodoblastus acidophilus TaxID=1074 RepID=UPI00222458B4|nr:NAD(+)--dinitrogen-reductase ADP-D-ribosyltransferase [Rhodoblastus acidophilus]MCW2315424.1 NAD+--dinitrogen-reductase ADP-D-ribosyltransferase [Rhodoblastus acidophilus]